MTSPTHASVRRPGAIVVVTAVIGIGLYTLMPRLTGFGSVSAAIARTTWWLPPLALALEAASLVCYAELMWGALRGAGAPTRRRVVYNVNLAGTALGRVLPGGTIMALPFSIRMLERRGTEPALATAALAGSGVLSSMVLAGLLPLAALVAMVGGSTDALAIGVLLFAIAMIAAGLSIRPALRSPERIAEVVRRSARPFARGPLAGFVHPDLIAESVLRGTTALRELAGNRRVLRRAVLCSAGNWLLDFAALAAVALTITDKAPLAGLPLAYVVGQLAAAIPLTPGGVGVVEASMTAALVAQGVPAAAATAAVLGWRLVSHWVPIMVGLVVFTLYQRVHEPRKSRLNRRGRQPL